MSLYIGKDTAGRNALVLTKNSVLESSIKNSNPSISNNYSFDSRLPFLNCEYIDLSFSFTETYTAFSTTYYRYSAVLPIGIVNNQAFILYYNGTVNQISLIEVPFTGVPNVTGTLVSAWYSGSTLVVTSPYPITSLKAVIFEYTRNHTSISNINPSAPITLSSNNLLVSGSDLFNDTFISYGTPNTRDAVVWLNGTRFQIINSNKVISNNKSVSLDSVSSTIVIAQDGHNLLNSSFNYPQLSSNVIQTKEYVFSSFTGSGVSHISNITVEIGSIIDVTYYPSVDSYPSLSTSTIFNVTGDTEWVPVFMQHVPTTPGPQPGNIITFMRIYNLKIEVKYVYVVYGDPQGTPSNINRKLICSVLGRI